MEWRNLEKPLFWLGAVVASAAVLWLLYRLLTGIRIWVLGNGKLLSPKLGRWAGEWGIWNWEIVGETGLTRGEHGYLGVGCRDQGFLKNCSTCVA